MSLDLSSWTLPDRGALFVVTGPSGAGKTTLVKEALRTIPGIQFSVSATTRPCRTGEVDGTDYHFVSNERMDQLVQNGEMLEWAQVYGNRYGTPRKPVAAALEHGQSVLLEIDAQGAAQVRVALPEAVTVFVLPPSIEALEQRLRSRSTDTNEVIERRMREARAQYNACGAFDFLITNDVLSSAHDQFQAVLVAELRRQDRRPTLVAHFGG